MTQTASITTVPPPELTQLRQAMARDLATMAQRIEQLRAGQEQMAGDNANLTEQFNASQGQLGRVIAAVSEQLKSSQEQMARDNASIVEQLKASQEQLDRVIGQISEQNGRATAHRHSDAQAGANTFVTTSESGSRGQKATIIVGVASAGTRSLKRLRMKK